MSPGKTEASKPRARRDVIEVVERKTERTGILSTYVPLGETVQTQVMFCHPVADKFKLANDALLRELKLPRRSWLVMEVDYRLHDTPVDHGPIQYCERRLDHDSLRWHTTDDDPPETQQ